MKCTKWQLYRKDTNQTKCTDKIPSSNHVYAQNSKTYLYNCSKFIAIFFFHVNLKKCNVHKIMNDINDFII